MATTTPNLGLRKPDDTDLVNVDTDLNDNLDKIDANPGIKTVADKAAIDALDGWAGRVAHAENEGQFGLDFWYDGTKWRPKNNQLVWANKLSASQAEFDSDDDLGVDGIPLYFAYYRINLKVRFDGSSTVIGVYVRCNGDSTAGAYNTYREDINNVGAHNVFYDNGSSQINIAIGTGGDATVLGLYGINDLLIEQDTEAGRRIVMQCTGKVISASQAQSWLRESGGMYESPELKRLQFLDASGARNLVAGSKITMYGLDSI